ncbi:Metal-dependent hydrolase, beta-lactamase superfamily I (fragment) [Candidatus Desulfosporosinus infrequens]|uniref:Metal-dependent hydrolase, beta-lactamase superfamily I n=1 Tax=Candidatus Desulfosporosinus infrequens TaxID=2043169 RepID=A0A2U3LH38_9FIRM
MVDAGVQFQVGDFIVLPFDTQHDCDQPFGYLIQYKPTSEKLIFCTDTYYIRNRFNSLNYILVESNYCKDTLDANIEAGYIPQSMKNRLLESHFSLEHVKEFLRANDLSQVKKIVLLHLSDSNSNAERMVREIEELTGKIVVIAEAGRNIPLELYPF